MRERSEVIFDTRASRNTLKDEFKVLEDQIAVV